MGNFIDLVGQKFGQLTVIKRGKNHVQPNGQQKTTWIVKCDCGRTEEFSVLADVLKNREHPSCRLCLNDNIGKVHFKDLTNNVFGNLLVLRQDNNLISKRVRHRIKWIVKCLCNRSDEFSVFAHALTTGNTTSCKICQYEKIGEYSIQDLTGNTFGLLKVKKLDHIDKNEHRTYWLCDCECGNKRVVRGKELQNGNTKSCGCLQESFVANKLKEYFIEKYNAKKEKKLFKNPKTNQWLRCDIYISKNKKIKKDIFIEVHGGQHYSFVEFFYRTLENFVYRQNIDKIKKEYCKENGVYVEIDLRKIKTPEKAIEHIETIIKNL